MRKFSLLVLALSLAACRDSGGGDDVVTPDAAGGGAQTIYDVQNDAMTAGTKVSLKGVIVTAIDNYGGKKGDFWVQEADGGEYSGVHVYGGPVDQVGALALGDIVDISGAQKAEFALTSDTSGKTLTELEPVDGGTMVITKVGSGPQVQPKVIDALAIGQLTDFMARHAEWEKWEGVLVTVNNVATFSDDECVGSMCTDTTLHKFDITGDIVVESALSAMPTPKIARNVCLAGVTGVVDYFFDYLIFPRETSEIMTGGTSCPAENTAGLCGDTMDNDGNGFKDCEDNACIGAVSSCRTVTTISAIQTAGTPPTGGIELQNVYVTALQRVTGSQKPRNMYVQTSLAASASNGILIFGNTTTDLSAYSVGNKVNVIGKVSEFNDSTGTGTLTEISLIAHSAGTAGGGTITAVTGQTAATLSVDLTGEPYEGVLVTLENVKLTTLADSMYHVGQMTQGATTFKFDDDLYRIVEAGSTTGTPVPVNTCYDTITGVWSYQVYDNAWYFLPSEIGDIVGGTCP